MTDLNRSQHIHLSHSAWANASRAWRAGAAALHNGFAGDVLYVGHRVAGEPDDLVLSPHQRVVRLGSQPPRPGSPRLLRALSLPSWWHACRQELSPDNVSLIIAHSLTALPGAVGLSKSWGTPLLYDAHELETERNGWRWPIRLAARAAEGHLIRACDHTIVVNDSIREWYENAYPGVSISTVRNAPVLPDSLGRSPLRETLRLSDVPLLFVYCGALGPGRGLPELVEAFRGLGPERHLALIGYGPLKEQLRRQSHNLPNVHLHDAVPQEDLITLLSGADIGVIVPTAESLSYRYMLPNKVFEYAAAGLAVCTGEGPEMRRFAEGYPGGMTAKLDVGALRAMALSWTRRELDRLRPEIAAFEPPSWQREQTRLLDAYKLAISAGKRRIES